VPHDTSCRFRWRRPPRHLPKAHEPLPPLPGPYTYRAFGPPAEPLPEADASYASGEGPLFQGMHYDPAQSSLFHPPLAFAPTLHPWANHDPVAYVDGMNWYTVEAANPIHVVYPLGE
jgi:hypothetical protein